MRPDLDAIRKRMEGARPIYTAIDNEGNPYPVGNPCKHDIAAISAFYQQAHPDIDALLTYVKELETSLNDVLEVTE